MQLNGATTTPTSTYPYTGIGPVDFSQLNLVQTDQVDYYYGYPEGAASSAVLMATVTQSYDPAEAMIIIFLLGFLFLALLFAGINKIKNYRRA